MTRCLELAEVSSDISQRLSEFTAPLIRVTRVLDSRTFEVGPSATHLGPKEFWNDAVGKEALTPEQKDKLYLQIQRTSSDVLVLSFILALQELCDTGISLHHEGQPVVDIWVLHTNEFDVSDIIDNRVPIIVDPVSGFRLSVAPTYEGMEKLREQGPDVCDRLAFRVPSTTQAATHLKKNRLQSYSKAIPHTWVAAIVEENIVGRGKERRMVHLDICAAAYDDAGIRMYNGSVVSLQIFNTPEYSLMPRRRMRKTVGHALVTRDKFVMESHTRPMAGNWKKPMIALQPLSIRHLRCFHRKDDSVVSVQTIGMFLARHTRHMSDIAPNWFEEIAVIRHNIVLRLPAGAEVIVCNLEKRPELNGRKGRVHESVAITPPTERIPVWVTGIPNPLSLKTTCIQLTTEKQYLSHNELHQRVEDVKEAPWEKDVKLPMTDRELKAFERALWSDPDMRYAYEVLGSRKYTMSCYADPKFNRGIRKILVPPFDRIMAAGMARSVRNGMTVADHPKSKEVYSILKVMRTAKEKVLEKDPSLARADGSVTVLDGSDHRRLLDKIVEKIQADPDLSELFSFMDDNGMFPNPVKMMQIPLR